MILWGGYGFLGMYKANLFFLVNTWNLTKCNTSYIRILHPVAFVVARQL